MTIADKVTTLLFLLVLATGCSAEHRRVPQLKTMPVTGQVEVDGKPALGVTVECHPEPGSAIKHPVSAVTDEAGKFTISMYQAGDGLPEGTYRLTFVWEFGMDQRDQLKRAYVDPKKSEHIVTVVNGEMNDLGPIRLTRGDKK